MANPYDDIPYPTEAEARLHVDHLRTCAVLNGYSPASPESARVLEIGCGNGFNLAPMAESFPDAHFLGLDSAATAIELGRRHLEAAGLRNIELRCVDLREAASGHPAQELGQFDYVICHGFYSWVPDDVRDTLWTFAKQILAPNGVFHLSYNALPGWYSARVVRDFATFVSGEAQHPGAALDSTWEALGTLAGHAESGNAFAQEAARLRSLPKSVLSHDELGECSQPFYLMDVVKRAKREGLRYAGEAGSPIPTDLRKHEDVAKMVSDISKQDHVMQMQLSDFTSMRRFHDSLFTHGSHAPTSDDSAAALLNCWARSDIHFVEEGAEGERVYEHADGIRISSTHPMFCAFADALQAAAPGSVCVKEFIASESAEHSIPEVLIALPMAGLLRQLVDGAVIRLRLSNVPVASQVPERPRTSAFARIQVAAQGSAANAYHQCLNIDEPWHRVLFTLLDGTRNHTEIVEALTERTWRELDGNARQDKQHGESLLSTAGSAVFLESPGLLESRNSLMTFYQEQVPLALESFVEKALIL